MKRYDGGAALVEVVLVCLILLVPISWGLAALDRVHRAALASTAAARDAGFEAVRATDPAAAVAAMERAVADAMRAQGLDPADAQLRWSAPDGFGRGARLEISVRFRVEVLGRWLPFAAVPVAAHHALYRQPFASLDA